MEGPFGFIVFCLVITIAVGRSTDYDAQQEGCPAVETLNNGWKSSDPWYPQSQKWYKTGDVIKFTCYGGNTRVGPKSITCLGNGKWSANIPKCKATSCVLSRLHKPENGQRYGDEEGFGSIVRFSCNRGYRMIGSKEVRCKRNGKWSSTSPWCKPECDFVSCKPGQKCTYSMDLGATKCICAESSECPFQYRPLCGSDRRTYANRCIMGSINCNLNKNIEEISKGECDENEKEENLSCPPCPIARICPVFYASTYAFLGEVVEKFNNKGDSIVLIKIIELYKPIGEMKVGDVIDVLHKKSPKTCSCVPSVPDAGSKMYLFGKSLTTTRDGREGMPVIDEETYAEEFYSYDQMNLCWLYR